VGTYLERGEHVGELPAMKLSYVRMASSRGFYTVPLYLHLL
jgi:hypothetical protein